MKFGNVLLRWSAVALVLTTASSTVAIAQGPYVASNKFGYTGTVSRYGSLADANAQINPLLASPYAIGQRDLSTYFVNNNGGFTGTPGFPSAFTFFTNTFVNPAQNNTNNGIVQIYDADGASMTSSTGAWTTPVRNQYFLSVVGANTLAACENYMVVFGPGDCSRFWNAGSVLGTSETTTGRFLSYQFDLLASGLTPATFNGATGVFESVSEPTTLVGTFTGIFQNQSLDDVGSNGVYRMTLNLNLTSSITMPGPGDVSVFGSNSVLPEPSTYALVGVGLLAVGFAARRRRGAFVGV